MARGKKHTAEQIVNLLRQVEVGVAENPVTTENPVTRKPGDRKPGDENPVTDKKTGDIHDR
jgi:hypothetical protein